MRGVRGRPGCILKKFIMEMNLWSLKRLPFRTIPEFLWLSWKLLDGIKWIIVLLRNILGVRIKDVLFFHQLVPLTSKNIVLWKVMLAVPMTSLPKVYVLVPLSVIVVILMNYLVMEIAEKLLTSRIPFQTMKKLVLIQDVMS